MLRAINYLHMLRSQRRSEEESAVTMLAEEQHPAKVVLQLGCSDPVLCKHRRAPLERAANSPSMSDSTLRRESIPRSPAALLPYPSARHFEAIQNRTCISPDYQVIGFRACPMAGPEIFC